MLSSLQFQTFKNFEILIFDDSSTDFSLNIIKKYSSKFKKYFFFRISHSGPSYIRNLGLIIASGKYVSFVDADDYLESDFLETLYKDAVLNDADIVTCGINFSKHNKIQTFNFHLLGMKSKIYNSKKLISKIILDIRMRSYLFNNFFKRSIFFDNNLIIPDMCYEDMAIMPQIFYFSNKVFIEKKKLYTYNIRKDSFSGGKMTEKKLKDYILSFNIIKSFFYLRECSKKYKIYLLIFKIKIVLIYFWFYLF